MHTKFWSRKTIGGAGLILLAAGAMVPTAGATGGPHAAMAAPFDGAYVEHWSEAPAEVPQCAADAGTGALAGHVVSHPNPEATASIGGQFSQGYCMTGVRVTDVRIPANRSVVATGGFSITAATADSAPGASEARVIPCVEIIGPEARARECNFSWSANGTNGLWTPPAGTQFPFVAGTGYHEEAFDETWTWSLTSVVPQGAYEVRAFLLLNADTDSTVAQAQAYVDGAVSSITVETVAAT